MHARLLSYLQDNQDQIVENWLTEAELPSPHDVPFGNTGEGVVPYTFYTHAFKAVLEVIEKGADANLSIQEPQFSSFLGMTCECRQRCFGGRVCMELHDSGLTAFMSVFADDWDTGHEFNELDRECCAELINHALSGFLGHEIDACPHKNSRPDCPFAAQN